MSGIAVEGLYICKKFRKGESYDCLRDFIPALIRGKYRKDKDRLGEREFWALKDVCFEVKRGEAVGIIGANGAGKSTLLKILSRIIKPTKGQMRVNGKLSALIEVGAGFHGDLTGRENIFLSGAILGMTKAEIRRKFDEIVEFAGLEEFIGTPVKRYSSGMYARLGFSVASHVEPEILLVDEILSVGDWGFQNKCMEKMKSIIKRGATVIFVSHNFRAVSWLCEKTMFLEGGRVVEYGITDKVINRYLAQEANGQKAIMDKGVFISRVFIRGENGEKFEFRSGQKIWIDVSVSCKSRQSRLSLVIELEYDIDLYRAFHISTDRLGCNYFPIEAGETRSFTFELTMHLARGIYRVLVALENDLDELLDFRNPAASILINSEVNILGPVNLYPRLISGDSEGQTI